MYSTLELPDECVRMRECDAERELEDEELLGLWRRLMFCGELSELGSRTTSGSGFGATTLGSGGWATTRSTWLGVAAAVGSVCAEVEPVGPE